MHGHAGMGLALGDAGARAGTRDGAAAGAEQLSDGIMNIGWCQIRQEIAPVKNRSSQRKVELAANWLR